MKIPYGVSNFGEIRRDGLYYVDKSRFIERLETAELGSRYLMLLRPRRFGKSLLVSLLSHYYDVALREDFDALFEGLWIHEHPTPERNQHLVLPFDFSPVSGSRDPREVERSFTMTVRSTLSRFLVRYDWVSKAFTRLFEELPEFPDAATMVSAVLVACLNAGRTVYLLVDEYDALANDLLACGHVRTYDELFLNTGFIRTFYKALKAGTQTGAIKRIFITGVTPIPLDDMASGFNILTQISHAPQFNALCGFTREEVAGAVDELLSERPWFGTREELMADMTRYYDGYRFSRKGKERVFNPDMVLYYLRHLNEWGEPPQNLLDENVRTDYTKLRAIASAPGASGTWHLELISELLTEGEVVGELVERFNRRTMYDQDHLVSLLYHMGLLTVAGPWRASLRFVVPNLVIRYLHWEELEHLFRQHAGVSVRFHDVQRAVESMAYEGELAPFLEQVRDEVLEKLSNRDLIRFDEKHLKVILLTYLSFSPLYRPLSEQEFKHGYADLFLALDHRFPDARVSWLLELKHLKAGSGDVAVEAAREEARAQIERYLADVGVLQALMGDREIRAATVVLVGSTDLRWWVERVVPGR